MHDFDSLPLVEFIPEGNIQPKKIVDLLRQDPPDDAISTKGPSGGNKPQKMSFGGMNDGWQENDNGDEQTL